MKFLPILALSLPLVACRITDPSSEPPESKSDDAAGSNAFAIYEERVRNFHLQWGTVQDSAYVANGKKVSPDDSIFLLPPDIDPPVDVKIRWFQVGDTGYQDLDPTKPIKVPLQDGILIFLVGSASPGGWNSLVTHAAISELSPPSITPANVTYDYLTDSISITSSRPGALIHFTLDGSYPNERSPVYTGKIPLDHPIWIRAMVQVPGQSTSLSTQSLLLAAGGWNPAVSYDTLIDLRDGQRYPTVRLGGLAWMAKNLNWKAPGATSRSLDFGGSYVASQVAAAGDSALCPEGWRVSSKTDWDSLVAWGTRQSGVTAANIGNALRKSAKSGAINEPIRMNATNPDYVDLFGFRATTTQFWTSTRGTDSASTILQSLSNGVLSSSLADTASTWSYVSPLEPYTAIPYRASVRCVHD